jgi:hypothetical protein
VAEATLHERVGDRLAFSRVEKGPAARRRPKADREAYVP